ncbi:sensor histidine kinase [Variovorax sp. VNK109]|uniref:sensor histidine kinase n=1 Tax=Variovorax sp. VNK109 TaxID=3400919 RepID=UPI003C1194A0
MTTAGQRPTPSLRTRLLRHVLLPLACTWLAGTLVAVGVAQFFAGRAFDRSLLDDAYLVAANVRLHGDQLALDLTADEESAVLFDQSESMLFSVHLPGGRFVGGHEGLEPAAVDAIGDDGPYQFHDLIWRGRSLRAVTLRREQPRPFTVVMAQTNRSRSALLQSVLLYSIVPQIVLLAGLALWLRRVIGRDTQPLAELEHKLYRRDERDLTPIHVAARTRDVQQLGDAINSLLARLDASLRAQREFAGNVAHELRTPLAGIRALAEYGLAQKDPQAWRAQLERIAGSEARASRLVDQLLALALAEEVRAGVAMEPVPLDVHVADAVLRFLPRADAAGVDLGARGADAPVNVHANFTLVEGILNNLIDNALRYARPPAGETPTVTVALAQDASGTTLSVTDNGPGLAPAFYERLSQRWAQGESGQVLGQGVGLGLAIVSQYAQLMGAKLALQPGAGGCGLTVSVMFPAPAAPGVQA